MTSRYYRIIGPETVPEKISPYLGFLILYFIVLFILHLYFNERSVHNEPQIRSILKKFLILFLTHRI